MKHQQTSIWETGAQHIHSLMTYFLKWWRNNIKLTKTNNILITCRLFLSWRQRHMHTGQFESQVENKINISVSIQYYWNIIKPYLFWVQGPGASVHSARCRWVDAHCRTFYFSPKTIVAWFSDSVKWDLFAVIRPFSYLYGL